jgi:putative ABC transport system permease protein
MLKSILNTSLRNLFRHRAFSLINLTGLAIGMSLGMMILLIVKEQYSFDNFHADIDKVYRVNTVAIRDGYDEPYASSPLPLAEAISSEYSFTDDVVSLNRMSTNDLVYGNINVPVSGFWVSPSFLQVFNFPLERGNAATALNDPKGIVLTAEMAQTVFGKQEPLGQTIQVGAFGEFYVTGVLKKIEGRTHFNFRALGSLAAIPLLEAAGKVYKSTGNWNNYYGSYNYIKLKEGANADDVTPALAAVVNKYYSDLKLETRDKGYRFELQPLGKITPGPELSNGLGDGMPEFALLFLGTLAIIVLVMACFNYTNLMIAKSMSRAREIGIRKVVGAQRAQVFFQFVGEAVAFSLITLIFSYVVLQFLKAGFNRLDMAGEFKMSLTEDVALYGYFIVFAVLVGVIAGLLPAGYLSSFRPAKVLKDSGNLVKAYSGMSLRKVLVVVQFAMSVAFVIVVLVIERQTDFMLHKDIGVNQDDILNLRLQGNPFDKVANEMANVPGVFTVAGLSHALGTGADAASDYRKNPGDEPFSMRDFFVDENYVNNLGMKFVAGKNFDPTATSDVERHVILNETALPLFKFTDPISAIGQQIYAGDSVELVVIGVVKDFNFRPMNYQIGPLALRKSKPGFNWVSMRIDASQKESVKAAVKAKWKTIDPVHEADMMIMRDQINESMTNAGFHDVIKIVGYISFLAVTLACLGMLGMAMYSTQTRVKEIGIRKVMGANEKDITFLLSRSFFYLVVIALAIGVPAGYFFANTFLEGFAYKIDITPAILALGAGIIVVLGGLTIMSQTWKAAGLNPAKSLRSE